MVKYARRTSALLLALLSLSGCCTPPMNESLPVAVHPQETGMWCWAASGQMVMDYLGHNVTQCIEANNRFGRNDCCNTPVPAACVVGGWPEFDRYGFTFKHTTDSALGWTDLRKQIAQSRYCGKRPFAFAWHWPGGGGHMMVAEGYFNFSLASISLRLVQMIDPLPVGVGDERWVTYDYYVSSAGHHTHWDDYYDVVYVGGH